MRWHIISILHIIKFTYKFSLSYNIYTKKVRLLFKTFQAYHVTPTVNQIDDLDCHSPTWRSATVGWFAALWIPMPSVHTHRQHQNICVGHTVYFQLTSIFYYFYHKSQCLVQFHAFSPHFLIIIWNNLHCKVY